MRKALFFLVTMLVSALKERRELALENLVLRQQLAVFKRSCQRPRLRNTDRLFWAWLPQVWERWREALILVKPETAVGWNRKRFKLFWARVSQRKGLYNHVALVFRR